MAALLRKAATLPGVQVWSGLTADALSRLDVSAAASRVALALQPIGSLLGKCIAAVISPATQGVVSAAVSATQPAILDEGALKGLKRLQERAAKADVDLWQLLWLGDTANWEQMITQSFAAGMSLELEESTMQQQLVHEFRVALLIGRRLCLTAESSTAIWEHLIGLVQQEGSLAHMLRRVTGPLLHHYALPAFQHGPDLAWLCMAP
ncbi:hypothetical protein OEZ86_007528 [Tetradesmus obliquus]|nr:hypothetical protein OEZ86_007528 [Tetradesmus obliquus]